MGFLHLVVGVGLVLGVMILVHEWGHFAMARFFKVRVDVFSIGFGPRLFGWKRGDTDYRISALPFGGYVRMAGQDPSEIDSVDHKWLSSGSHEEADERPKDQSKSSRDATELSVKEKLRNAGWATSTATGDSGTGDHGTGELMSKPRWQRALISFAGPAVNLLFPILLLGGFFILKGEPYSSYLNQPVQIVSLSSDKDVPRSDLQVGDAIKAIDGMPVATWEQAYKAIDKAGVAEPLQIQVESRGVMRTVSVPVKNASTADLVLGYPPRRPVLDEIAAGYPADHAGLRDGDVVTAVDGQPIQYWGQFVDRVRNSGGKTLALDIERKGKIIHTSVTPQLNPTETGDSTYQVGVAVKDETLYRRVPLTQSLHDGITTTGLTIQRTAETVGLLFSGKVSINQLQGPVGISHAAKQAVDRGPLAVISLMVLISVNLGILNLLPIPILDGGNILLLAIEGIMRRDLSLSFKERFVQVGLVFLLVLFAIVMYHDVLRRLSAHS
jgi:regulator of sigma E protease